jgi:hypothetical protein
MNPHYLMKPSACFGKGWVRPEGQIANRSYLLSWSLIMAFFEKGMGFIGGYSVDGMHLASGQIPLRVSSSRFFSATF